MFNTAPIDVFVRLPKDVNLVTQVMCYCQTTHVLAAYADANREPDELLRHTLKPSRIH